jgi:hypothetical protein
MITTSLAALPAPIIFLMLIEPVGYNTGFAVSVGNIVESPLDVEMLTGSTVGTMETC